jgi:mono/diheme cytochrome c family protein
VATLALGGIVRRTLVAIVLATLVPAVARSEETPKRVLEIYKQKCQLCHKADGTGISPAMSFADGKWIHGSSLSEVRRVIADGVKGKSMMGYGKQLDPADIEALARYVRTFDKALKPEPPAAK